MIVICESQMIWEDWNNLLSFLLSTQSLNGEKRYILANQRHVIYILHIKSNTKILFCKGTLLDLKNNCNKKNGMDFLSLRNTMIDIVVISN